MKPHKHAELIKAWADGAEIEERYNDAKQGWSDWTLEEKPQWWTYDSVEYRIKPEPMPEPEKQWLYIYNDNTQGKTWVSKFTPQQHGLSHLLSFEYMGKIEVTK
jgi:hypothetical protein